MMQKLGLRFALVMVIGMGLAGVAHSQEPSPTSTQTQTVQREVLASGHPDDAAGKVLALVRYTIPAGAKLPPHIHPGMQVVTVESGTLTYTVVEGRALIQRANGQEETLAAGQTTRLMAGDALTEPGGMVHFGENQTADRVVLLSASLLDTQKPAAILVR